MEDIAETVQYARERGLDSSPSANKYLSLKSMSGSEDGLDRSEMADPKVGFDDDEHDDGGDDDIVCFLAR